MRHTLVFTIGVLLMLMFLSACAPKKQPTTKQEQTFAGGLALVKDGHVRYQQIAGKLTNTPLDDRQKGYVAELNSGEKQVYDGAISMEKPCDDAIKANESSRQSFYHSLDYGSLIGVGATAFGVAMLAIGFFNQQKSMLAWGGALALSGISLAVVCQTFRAVTPWLPWAMGGVGLIFLCAIGVFVYDRVKAARDRLKRERQLEAEQLATKELQKSIETTLDYVPEEVKPAVLHKLANEVQSPTTQALAMGAKNDLVFPAPATATATTTVSVESPTA
jgi:hypothetical protein